MASYEIRFVRPDNSYAKKTLECEFESDSEAWHFLVQTYPQRATETWSGSRLVFRRVSPAHDARLRGHYPKVCRFPTISIHQLEKAEADFGEISDPLFDEFGRCSLEIFYDLRETMAIHQVWVRATGHPEAPPTVHQRMGFIFWLQHKDAAGWHGVGECSIRSREIDGPEVVNDILDAAAECLFSTFSRLEIGAEPKQNFQRSEIVSFGLDLCSALQGSWIIRDGQDSVFGPVPRPYPGMVANCGAPSGITVQAMALRV